MQYDYSGNVINPVWFSTITKPKGAADLVTINILADIIYWHTPTVKREEGSNKVISISKKYKADKLQKSYNDYATLFGVSKDTIINSFKKLEKLGIIKREFRNIFSHGNTINNVMFLDYYPENLEKVNTPIEEKTVEGSEKNNTLSEKTGGGGGKNTHTYTESTTKTTTNSFLQKDNSSELENLEDNFDLPEQLFEPNKEQGVVPPKKEVGKKEKTSEQREKSAQITAILLHIKAECKKNGVIFGSSTKERNAICWMMGKKFQEECLDEVKMDLLTFISMLIKTAVAIKFRKPINSPESIYYNRAECVNKARQIRLAKEEKEKPKLDAQNYADAFNEKIRLQAEESERLYQAHLLLKKQQKG